MPRWVLIAALLVLAAGAGLLLSRLLGHRPTDEEQIRALFDQAAQAAEEKRIGDVVAGVSERFQGEGLDKRAAKQLVAIQILRGTWVAVMISGASIEVRGDTARAVVHVVMSRSGKGTPLESLLPEQATVHRFGLELAREEGRWMVTTAAWRPITLQEALAGPELPAAPTRPLLQGSP